MIARVCAVRFLAVVIGDCGLRVPWSGAKDKQVATRASSGRVSLV